MWYDIRTPDKPVNWPAMSKMFQTIVRKTEPYVAIYRFQLDKGRKYTFQSEYPADHIIGSACLRGVNPLAASKHYNAPSGTAGLILCRNRGFPGGNIKGYVFGRKSNFTTSVKSQHNSAYLVISSEKPNTPFRFRMNEPAEKDNFIRKKGGYQKKPGQDTFYSWSNVHKDKLWMGYAKGEKKVPQMSIKKTTHGPSMATPLSQSQMPANLIEWIKYIQSGRPFFVVFDKTKDKFDDSTYTGDWRSDPMGTLKGGETYQGVYKNGNFTCRGFHQHKNKVYSTSSGGINPDDGRISLWGRTYVFDGLGIVWDQTYGIVGHLAIQAEDPTTSTSTPKGIVNFQDHKGNTIQIPCGKKAFSDSLVTFKPGNPKPVSSALNPNMILGQNDYNKSKDSGYVSLGCGGSIVVGFSRVALIDVDGPDLYIFEIGSSVEPMKVELSKDALNWISVGTVRGGTGALDIHGRVKQGERFRYVRLTDLKSSCSSSKWPGADVDAIAAIGCVETAADLPHFSGVSSSEKSLSERAVTKKNVVSRKVPASGGTLTISRPGTPLHGFSIKVPTGSYPQAKTFTVSSGPVPSYVTGEHIKPITPLIWIENGGDYSDELMEITIPVTSKPGYFAMPFFLDTVTGKLEGIPVVSWQEDHIVAVSHHFSAFFVSEIAIDALEKINKIDTGFKPGRDNWGFINKGSYVSPRGICSGMTMTAMWYYLEQYPSSHISLQKRFDNLPRNFATPGLGWDDSLGIKWASAVQKDQNNYSQRAGIKVVREWETKSAGSFDQGVWYCFAYSMLVTHEPQYISIQGHNTATNKRYGHALAAYAIDMNTGTLSVYDPNYEISKGRNVFFDKNTRRFKNYTSALNAKQLETGSGLPFEKFKYFAKSAIVNWKKVGKRWNEVEAESIAQGLFPTYHWMEIDKKNQALGKILKTHQTHKEIIRLKTDADIPAAFYPGKIWRVSQFNSDGRRPNATIVKTKAKSKNGIVDIPLKPGLNRIGIRVLAKPQDHSYEWIGFDWFEIIRSKVTISPIKPQAIVGIPLAFKASVEPPFNGTVYHWDWGDGAAMETGSQNTGAHTWTHPGIYTVTADVRDHNDDTKVGQATTQVTVGVESLPAASKTSGCPENLLAWCKKNNYRPLKCLKCKPRVESISGCIDCDFPRSYKGSGGWTMIATSTMGAKKTDSCSESLTITATLLKGKPGSRAPARFKVDGVICVDRDHTLSPRCKKCPGKPMQFNGWHDQKGRAGFEIQDWGLVFDIRYNSKTMSSGASGKMDWGDVTQGEDLATNNVSFELDRVD